MDKNQPILQPQYTFPQVAQQLDYPLDQNTQQILAQFINIQAFPINSIYTTIDPTNPATVFGYGTWTSFATGRTLVGVDAGQTEFNTVQKTGGEKTHTLTISEMPSHTHPNVCAPGISGNLGAGSGLNYPVSSGSTGGDGAHNNLQPYITVYFWLRTA